MRNFAKERKVAYSGGMPFISTNLGQIFYAQHGTGVPMLFLHGAGGTHQHWGLQLRNPALIAHKLAFDLPSHGRSPGPAPTSISAYAAHTLAFLDALGIERSALVGHSMGGAIALQIALDYPQRVSHLAMLGSGARLPVFPELMTSFAHDPSATVAYIASKSYGPNASAALRASSSAALRRADAALLQSTFHACDRFDLRHRLHNLNCPTLIIYGTEDAIVDPERSSELHAAIAHGTLIAIEQVGHMSMLEVPDVISAALSDLIEAQE